MSGGDQAMSVLYLILVLVLVGSALVVRRIPISQGLKLFAAWILIFGAAFLIFYALEDTLRGMGIVPGN